MDMDGSWFQDEHIVDKSLNKQESQRSAGGGCLLRRFYIQNFDRLYF